MSRLPMKWAERDDRLYITVEASNATDVKISFEEKKVFISGKGITAKSSEPRELKDELSLYKEINPSESTFKVLGTCVQVCAIKKDKGYWEKLVDGPSKGWLTVDWNLWKDEDDVEEKAADDFGGYGDMSSMMGGGMGGMGGAGGMDLASMMGGMGGAGGMDFASMMGGMGGAGAGEGEEMDSDDEAEDEELKDLDN